MVVVVTVAKLRQMLLSSIAEVVIQVRHVGGFDLHEAADVDDARLGPVKWVALWLKVGRRRIRREWHRRTALILLFFLVSRAIGVMPSIF